MSKISLSPKVEQLVGTQTLANAPWPPADSHCSVCACYANPEFVDEMLPFGVYGGYYGDYNRKRYRAMTGCVEPTAATLKRFMCLVAKGYPTGTVPPSGDGLFIGLVNQATLNDINLLHDPNSWWWAGYLADLPTGHTQGQPYDYYYISVDINQSYPTPTEALYLVALTNANYNGYFPWNLGGYGQSGGVRPDLDFWQFNLNEPGVQDGWALMDSYFDAAYVNYVPGEAQLWEGFCTINSPNFPATATEGTPYYFDFTEVNELQFPCGCPEVIWWQLFDRDTGNPVGDMAIYEVECGYTGVNFQGGIDFQGGGYTFHGQLVVGHAEGETAVPDDLYNFDIVVTALPCNSWTNSTDCFNHGCYWWNNQCRTDPPTYCEDITNESDCTLWGCYWYGGACHYYPSCEAIGDENTCWGAGCFWYNGSCHTAQPGQCSDFNNQGDCLLWGCYWWGGACHAEPEPQDLCAWLQANWTISITDVFVIIDSYVLNNPPSGYGFIPTLTQVFGVIDYYLGFNGDSKTGCDMV